MHHPTRHTASCERLAIAWQFPFQASYIAPSHLQSKNMIVFITTLRKPTTEFIQSWPHHSNCFMECQTYCRYASFTGSLLDVVIWRSYSRCPAKKAVHLLSSHMALGLRCLSYLALRCNKAQSTSPALSSWGGPRPPRHSAFRLHRYRLNLNA